MFKLFLKNFYKGLRSRYRYTYRRDKQELIQWTEYYFNPRRFIELFYFYNIFEIMFLFLRFAFKLVFWWPILAPYLMFCYIVRYMYIPWHYLFLDLILPFLEHRLGGSSNASKSYFYRFIRFIYQTFAWIEKFLLNFFGVRLLWRWWCHLWLERIPDYLGRNSDNIAYGILYFLEAIIWVWKTWSRLWDYVMSWFNPWSYWKTRYYLSAYFRDKMERKYIYYSIVISLLYYNNDFSIRYYVAFYFYGLKLLFFNLKFLFSKPFIIIHYNYYRNHYFGKLHVYLSYKFRYFLDVIWALSPNTLSFFLSCYWFVLSLLSSFIKPFFRVFYNYKLSYKWRWIKLRKKGELLGLGKKAGKWFPWLTNRRKPK